MLLTEPSRADVVVESPAQPEVQRIILLGASNLTFSFPLVVESLRRRYGTVEIVAAHGHGRAYGQWNQMLTRGLPGIVTCRLWKHLERHPAQCERPLALITDVGNDLVYGATVEELLGWVRQCLLRLQDHGAQTTISLLPIGSIERLTPLHYNLARAIMFNGRGPRHAEMHESARRLDEGLQHLAAEFDAGTIRPKREWYGVDPIHVRRRSRATAWAELCSAWFHPRIENVDLHFHEKVAPLQSLRYWRLAAEFRRRFGKTIRNAQPACRLEDGGTISVF